MTTQHDNQPDLSQVESEKIARDSLTKEQKKFIKSRQSESDFEKIGKENVVYKNNQNQPHKSHGKHENSNRLLVHDDKLNSDTKKRVMIFDVTSPENKEPDSSSHECKPATFHGKSLKPFKLSKSHQSLVPSNNDAELSPRKESLIKMDSSHESHITSPSHPNSHGLVTSQSLTVTSSSLPSNQNNPANLQQKSNKVSFITNLANHNYQRSEFDFRYIHNLTKLGLGYSLAMSTITLHRFRAGQIICLLGMLHIFLLITIFDCDIDYRRSEIANRDRERSPSPRPADSKYMKKHKISHINASDADNKTHSVSINAATRESHKKVISVECSVFSPNQTYYFGYFRRK